MTTVFVLKKILTPFFYPLSLCLEFLFLGLLLLWVGRFQRAGKVLVTMGTLLLALMSYAGIGGSLLAPLEANSEPLVNLETLPAVKWVVVLGGAHTTDQRLTDSEQLSEPALRRLVEGIRLQRALQGSKLVVSGGKLFGSKTSAAALASAARSLGVAEQDIVVEPRPVDTAQEAKFITQDIVGEQPFLLVTSTTHMPRSMTLFKAQGAHPIPAPADFLIKRGDNRSPGRFFPTADALLNTQRAFHEYLGLLWGKLREQFSG